jgi:hypothetical protein
MLNHLQGQKEATIRCLWVIRLTRESRLFRYGIKWPRSYALQSLCVASVPEMYFLVFCVYEVKCLNTK